jgi:glycine cleavage system aminomethyltransferase T
MSYQSLEDKIRAWGNPVEMLRNAPAGPYPFPIRGEFSNWRDEQEAWRKAAVLFDQSYHMSEYRVEGPDVKRLLSEIAVNSMANFERDLAKQIVVCNPAGYYIADAILFILDDNLVNIVNKPTIGNWIEYQIATRGYDVMLTRDERSLDNPRPRRNFRFEIQGPHAWEILERATGGSISPLKFFRMGEIKVAGHRIRALRHGMAGAPGLELFGPYELGEAVKAALVDAGKDFGLRLAGSRAYSTVAHESGWFPSAVPAIYSGDDMKAYREWLPGDGFEANSSLGGSMVSPNIEDYYLSPFDMGYGHIVKFDHDFVGRDALESKKNQPHLHKVTLKWNNEDVIRVFASLFNEGERYKYMDVPASHYATMPYDNVNRKGKRVGISHYPVYTSNVRSWISLALVEESVAAPGTEVSITWGEPGGGSSKPTVERHVQTEIRAVVHPCPISVVARELYRKGVGTPAA